MISALVSRLYVALAFALLVLLPAAARCAPVLVSGVCEVNLDLESGGGGRGGGRAILRGQATGEACRFSVRYGAAERWSWARAVESLQDQDTTALPPSCPQDASPVVGAKMDEDCLYAVVYAPKGVQAGLDLPVMVWIHGGSYIAGSASAPGLDASNLAVKGNMVVVVLQYRLGALGFLPPSDRSGSHDPNLALGDVILALKSIQRYARALGADGDKVTLAGQSSGGSLVRALLAAPEARGLFRAAIIQSDPMTYGTASREATRQLRSLFFSYPQMGLCGGDEQCLRRKPLADVLAAQARLMKEGPAIRGVPFVMPIPPSHGFASLPADDPSRIPSFASGPNTVPLLITTTANEAGQVVQALFPAPIPADSGILAGVLSTVVGVDRTQQILGAGQERYALSSAEAGDGQGGAGDIFRETLERLVTDGVWRCAGRDFAVHWARQGGKVWMVEWGRGARYVSNEGGTYCRDGKVCHEDDIIPTFQSGRGGHSELDEVLGYWAGFIHHLDPNQAVEARSPGAGGAEAGPGAGGSNIAFPPPAPGDAPATPPSGSVSRSSTINTYTSASSSPTLRQGWREPGRDGSRFLLPPQPAPASAPLPMQGTGTGPVVPPAIRPGPGTPQPAPVLAARSTSADEEVARRQLGLGGTGTRPRWERYGSQADVRAIGGGEVGLCPEGFWGGVVPFDWQLYG